MRSGARVVALPFPSLTERSGEKRLQKMRSPLWFLALQSRKNWNNRTIYYEAQNSLLRKRWERGCEKRAAHHLWQTYYKSKNAPGLTRGEKSNDSTLFDFFSFYGRRARLSDWCSSTSSSPLENTLRVLFPNGRSSAMWCPIKDRLLSRIVGVSPIEPVVILEFSDACKRDSHPIGQTLDVVKNENKASHPAHSTAPREISP